MRIDIWSDVICPWCYLGRQYLHRALESYDGEVEVVHHAFELDPSSPRDETPLTVKRLATKYGMSPAQALAAQTQMTARAAEAGLTFNLDGQRSGNTRDAHRLVQLARQRGVQDAMLDRLYRAYFTDGRSIFETDSLAALADEVEGMDADEVAATLRTGAFDEQVLADEEQAYTLGVTGVPFFVIDRRFGMSGAQPPEVLVRALEHAAAEPATT
ncbi:MAG TPA: DsbA family oxidoreductase [Mycobacteriales bacterium]|jgi:predicted DsbA family dithiol-disulfide isomerase|nr:DsbA family oxidoreductase [Mycobacteriales bacterium]